MLLFYLRFVANKQETTQSKQTALVLVKSFYELLKQAQVTEALTLQDSLSDFGIENKKQLVSVINLYIQELRDFFEKEGFDLDDGGPFFETLQFFSEENFEELLQKREYLQLDHLFSKILISYESGSSSILR